MEKMMKLLKENMETAKKILAVSVVFLALAVFWIFGGEEDLTVETGGAPESHGETLASGMENADGSGETEKNIYVDIGGEVNAPGVYCIADGTRLFQVIEEAGGLKETADTDSINQAEAVTDGQKIIIGSRNPESPYYTGTSQKMQGTDAGADTSSAVRQTEDGFKVNLNRATLEELQLIPGVGPSTAQKILDYRKDNGKFSSITDLKNISGIGEKTYNNMKEYIEV